MGVQHFMGPLEACGAIQPTTLATILAGQKTRAGVDGSMLIHMVLPRHTHAILAHDDWTGFERDVLREVKYLKSLSPQVEYVFVLDGHRISAKLANAERAGARNAALKVVNDKYEKRVKPTKHEQSIAIGSHVIKAAKVLYQVLKPDCIERVDVKVAPGEAEHQLVELQNAGEIKWIICNDSDYILLGGTCLVFIRSSLRAEARYFARGVFDDNGKLLNNKKGSELSDYMGAYACAASTPCRPDSSLA